VTGAVTEIRLHDTATREKRTFEPADPARVTMYVCGPTVYNRAHIGNARPAVVFDVLARLLRHVYGADSLAYARNVTDIDDKIMAAADREGVATQEVAARFERFYDEDMSALGVLRPTIAPRATEHVAEMIAMIARLIEGGAAYDAGGHVLYSVAADPGYGSLSGRDREAMAAGARVEVAPYKRDPADFVLWKPSEPAQPGWDSPWGRGRPGWHIECSAMIAEHLGETIDIHGGGQDLVFPHHENEAAQSRAAHGRPLARYWLHNGFLSVDAEKMSKSIGNVVTVAELLAQGWDGEVIRLALLSAHYRQPLEWSDELLAQSKARLDRWYRARARLEAAGADRLGHRPDSEVVAALADDLNTPRALALVGPLLDRALELESGLPAADSTTDAFRTVEASLSGLRAAELLGLLERSSSEWFQGGGDDGQRVEQLIEARKAARRNKDFAEADRIRDELAAEGILLEDGPAGTTWRRA
jgi:cysteinyl-tRNA synthetase